MIFMFDNKRDFLSSTENLRQLICEITRLEVSPEFGH